MSSSGKRSLGGAVTLGASGAIDYVIQFVLPVILVRSLDANEFGQYRILWLLTNTLMAFAPMYMPQSLFYFLPRALDRAKASYVANVVWYLVLSGLITAICGAIAAGYFLGTARELPMGLTVVPVFLLVWVVSTLLDWLPNTEGRIGAQARINIGLSFLRAAVVGSVAFFTKDITAVFWSLLVFAIIKTSYLMIDIFSRYGPSAFRPDWQLGRVQLKYALPFGLAGSLYVLRQQIDQWIVASLFPVGVFAAFSIAGVVSPLAGLVRQSVSNAILPAMNKSHGLGQLDEALAINRKANSLVAVVLIPILLFLFVFADDILTIIYTKKYALAAAPMRVYLIGLIGQVFVVNNLLITLAQGKFQLKLNVLFLAVGAALSFLGAYTFGLVGAALGTAIAQWGSHIVSVRHVAATAHVRAKILLDFPALFACFVSAFFASITAWGAGIFITPTSLITRLTSGAAIFILVYVGTVLALPHNRKLLKRLIK